MCGICGILRSPEKRALERMSDSLANRGPDDAGFFFEGPIALGVRRLSIIDIKAGHQPIFNEDGSICVVFNGEIYNHMQLREYLSSLGHCFSTDSDTEVIIHAFEEFGKECVKYLRGMFAFALWDSSNELLFLARDRFGIKPLFFSRTKDSFVFASNVKSIFSSDLIKREIDEQTLYEQAIFGCSIGDSTLFKGVKRLLPGHTLTIGSSGHRLEEYWVPRVSSDFSISEQFAARKMNSLCDDAARLETLSDVGFGLLLSGGLDSSALTSVVSSFSKDPVDTFSISDDESNEDLKNARLVSEHLGTDHHEFIVSSDHAISSFPEYIMSVEDISPHFQYGIWMHILSKRVSDHCKVVLCGQGVDELFAGYEYLADAQHFKNEHLVSAWHYAAPPASFRRTAFFNDLLSDIDSRGHDAMLSYELSNPLPNNQLALFDSASMHSGLETRLPFLDAEFAHFAMQIPFSFKTHNGIEKYVLRKAFSNLDLPKAISKREKSPAGASTLPGFSRQFNSLADSLISDDYLSNHRYSHLLRSKGSILSFDLLDHLFIESCGLAKGFEISSLY